MPPEATKTAFKSGPEVLTRLYRTIFEASHDVLVVQDERGQIIDINPRAAQITGYDLSMLHLMNVPDDLAFAEDSAKIRQILADVRDGHAKQYQIRWRAKDGHIIEFDGISVPISIPGQAFPWTYCSLRDVTRRNAIERDLRESEKRLQQIIATLPVGLAVTDRAGDITMTNRMLKYIWGDVITDGDERWMRSKGYWHEDGRRIEADEWASVRALKEGRSIVNELIDIETFEGLHKTVQNSSAPIRGEDGEIVGAIIVNEDVTQRVRAETDLRNALEELKALSRKLVEVQEMERQELSRELHDRIGQNLTALGFNLETVTARLGKEDPDVVSRLRDSRELLKATFDAMLDLLAELRPPMLDDAGLPEALQWYGKQFSTRTGLRVAVTADRARRLDSQSEIILFRVAQEALNNVAKHAHARHVDIELVSSKDGSVLSISDDGVGFEANPNGGAGPAPGFGMVTMRERARAIGGEVEVRRRAEGGTSVIVRVKQA
jgi:two-component system sensor histidine kinase UhpB